MRYIYIDGQVIPKHCIYGPRQAEGIVVSDCEWWRITDHLVKEQRERELSAALKAKEEAKIALSHDMTRDWSNTLASIKTLGNQKRLEKREKEKQDKIDRYNAILKDRTEENKKRCEQIKKIVFEEKDAAKTVNMGVLYSLVLDERNKQIERKNLRKAEEVKKDKEIALRLKKEAEDFRRELEEERIEEWKKKIKQRELLDKQMEERKKKRQKELEEFEAAKQDLIRMRLEQEKIQKCEALDKCYRKKFAQRFLGRTEKEEELRRKMALELEVEDEINQIYLLYDRKIKKERLCRERELIEEENNRRSKIVEFLGKGLLASAQKERALLSAAIEERELRLKKEEAENEEKRRQMMASWLEEKKKAEERMANVKRKKEEEVKWGMIQQYRSAEINEEQTQAERRHKKAVQAEVRKALDCQMKQLNERKAEELKEWLTPLENDVQDTDELNRHCEEALSFARELHLPDYPIRAAIAKVKAINKIVGNNEELQQKKEEEGNCRQQKLKTMASGCYCFKY